MLQKFTPISYVLFLIFSITSDPGGLYAKERIINPELGAFVERFVNHVGSSKVEYNGQTLTIYKAPSNTALVGASFGLLLGALCGVAALNTKDDKDRVWISFFTAILCLCCGGVLYKELDYDSKNIPLITLTSAGIRYKGKLVTWAAIKRIKAETTKTCSEYGTELHRSSTIILCDEYLDALMKLDDIDNHLPFTVENLFVLLEKYLEKSEK